MQDTKGGIAFCRFLCNFSLNLQMLSVNLRPGTVTIQYTGMKASVMQDGAVFPGPLSSLPTVLNCAVPLLHNLLFQSHA